MEMSDSPVVKLAALAREMLTGIPSLPSPDQAMFQDWQLFEDVALLCVTDIGNASSSRFSLPGDRYMAVLRDGTMFTFPDSPRAPVPPTAIDAKPKLKDADVRRWLEAGDEMLDAIPEWMRQHILDTCNIYFSKEMRAGREKTLQPENASVHERERGYKVTEDNVMGIVREIAYARFSMPPLTASAPAP